ncbi:MAG: type II toxin-antitoxin system ChpB family toxin [Pseudomonadota bacterium]
MAKGGINRGDIYHCDLAPVKGREQQGARYTLVVSIREFNELGTQIVCPITQGGDFARNRGFAVSLSGSGTSTQGVVLVNQLRALDLKARNGKFIERTPDNIVQEVLGRLTAIFE